MTYRPYPNRDRALHQLDRHIDEVGPMVPPRPMTPLEQKMIGVVQMSAAVAGAALTSALRRAQPAGGDFVAAVDEYRLSTR